MCGLKSEIMCQDYVIASHVHRDLLWVTRTYYVSILGADTLLSLAVIAHALFFLLLIPLSRQKLCLLLFADTEVKYIFFYGH